MSEDNILVASNVVYYHQHDETAFFEWLARIGCVERFYGEGRSLFICLKRRPKQDDLRELLAFFFRYGIDMTQLARFETQSISAWLRNPQAYWHERMFGGQKGELVRRPSQG